MKIPAYARHCEFFLLQPSSEGTWIHPFLMQSSAEVAQAVTGGVVLTAAQFEELQLEEGGA